MYVACYQLKAHAAGTFHSHEALEDKKVLHEENKWSWVDATRNYTPVMNVDVILTLKTILSKNL